MNMPKRELHQIIQDLRELKERDFDLNYVDANGIEKCYELMDEILELEDPTKVIDEILLVFERLPDSDLGTPGPLLSGLEKISGYEERLIESVERQPVPQTVFAINGLLNLPQSIEERHRLMTLLESTLHHTRANERTREDAKYFLEWQRSSQRLAQKPLYK
jgi:hypothetical protein